MTDDAPITCISLLCEHKNRCATHLHHRHAARGPCQMPEIIGDLCRHYQPTPSRWGVGPDAGVADYE